MKILALLIITLFLFQACGSDAEKEQSSETVEENTAAAEEMVEEPIEEISASEEMPEMATDTTVEIEKTEEETTAEEAELAEIKTENTTQAKNNAEEPAKTTEQNQPVQMEDESEDLSQEKSLKGKLPKNQAAANYPTLYYTLKGRADLNYITTTIGKGTPLFGLVISSTAMVFQDGKDQTFNIPYTSVTETTKNTWKFDTQPISAFGNKPMYANLTLESQPKPHYSVTFISKENGRKLDKQLYASKAQLGSFTGTEYK